MNKNKLYYDRERFQDCNIAEDIMLSDILDYILSSGFLGNMSRESILNHIIYTYNLSHDQFQYVYKLTKGLI